MSEMNGSRLLGVVIVWSGCAADPADEISFALARPPETRRDDVVEIIHGREVHDPYRWLERGDEPDIRAWTLAQDGYARSVLDRFPHRMAIRRELDRTWRHDGIDIAVHKRGQRYFYGRRFRDRERVVYYVREGADGPERPILDPDELSADGSVSIKNIFPSPDGETLAYTVSRYNADAATLAVRDVRTGRDRPIDFIEGAMFADPQWIPDSSAFDYTHIPVDASIPPDEITAHATIRRHVLGRPAREDEIVFGPTGDARTLLHANLAGRGRYRLLHIVHGSAGRSDVYVQDLHHNDGLVPVIVGADARTLAFGDREHVFLFTSEGAPRYRIVEVDPSHPSPAHWREVVPQRAMTLDAAGLMYGHFVLSYLDDLRPHVEVIRIADGRRWIVSLPDTGAVSRIWGHPENREAMLLWSSLADRPRIFRIPLPDPDAVEVEPELWAAENDEDTAGLVMRRLSAWSLDGTKVPVFVLHRADLDFDGSRPTILTGYGGFGINITPQYNTIAHLWARQGGVWAQASLRGGGEFGEDWHRQGKGSQKTNVFDDFIAAADLLFAQGLTQPRHLGILGGSNGGLLVGAAMTQHPERFGAVVCMVPLLDMVRYHRFGRGPLWIDEYGSADQTNAFDTLFAYSPYHHIESHTPYPPMLMVSAQRDDRVDPLHARKFVAALQAGDRTSPVLFWNEQNGGHGGADALSRRIEMHGDILTFLFGMLSNGRGAG